MGAVAADSSRATSTAGKAEESSDSDALWETVEGMEEVEGDSRGDEEGGADGVGCGESHAEEAFVDGLGEVAAHSTGDEETASDDERCSVSAVASKVVDGLGEMAAHSSTAGI